MKENVQFILKIYSRNYFSDQLFFTLKSSDKCFGIMDTSLLSQAFVEFQMENYQESIIVRRR